MSSIVAFVKEEELEEAWPQTIVCHCGDCGGEFEQNTEEFVLDADDPVARCPCGNQSPVSIKTIK